MEKRFGNDEIKQFALDIETTVKNLNHAVSSADIQELVERAISSNYDVLRSYIEYRYAKQTDQHANTTDASILSLLLCLIFCIL